MPKGKLHTSKSDEKEDTREERNTRNSVTQGHHKADRGAQHTKDKTTGMASTAKHDKHTHADADTHGYTATSIPFALTQQQLLLRVLHGPYRVPILLPKHREAHASGDAKDSKDVKDAKAVKDTTATKDHKAGAAKDVTAKTGSGKGQQDVRDIAHDPRADKANFAKLISSGRGNLHKPQMAATDSIVRDWHDRVHQRWRFRNDDTAALMLPVLPRDYRHLPGNCVLFNDIHRNPLTADTDSFRQQLVTARTALNKVGAPVVYVSEDFFSPAHITATDAQGSGVKPVTRSRAEFTGKVHARARDNARNPLHVLSRTDAPDTAKEKKEDVDALVKQARTPMSATLMQRALATNPHDIRLKPVDFERALATGKKALHHVDMDAVVWSKKNGGYRLRRLAQVMALQRNPADVRLQRGFADALKAAAKRLHKADKTAQEHAGMASLAVGRRAWLANKLAHGEPTSVKAKEAREKLNKERDAKEKQKVGRVEGPGAGLGAGADQRGHAAFCPDVSDLTATKKRLHHVPMPADKPLLLHMGLPGTTAMLGKGLAGTALAACVGQRGGHGRSAWEGDAGEKAGADAMDGARQLSKDEGKEQHEYERAGARRDAKSEGGARVGGAKKAPQHEQERKADKQHAQMSSAPSGAVSSATHTGLPAALAAINHPTERNMYHDKNADEQTGKPPHPHHAHHGHHDAHVFVPQAAPGEPYPRGAFVPALRDIADAKRRIHHVRQPHEATLKERLGDDYVAGHITGGSGHKAAMKEGHDFSKVGKAAAAGAVAGAVAGAAAGAKAASGGAAKSNGKMPQIAKNNKGNAGPRPGISANASAGKSSASSIGPLHTSMGSEDDVAAEEEAEEYASACAKMVAEGAPPRTSITTATAPATHHTLAHAARTVGAEVVADSLAACPCDSDGVMDGEKAAQVRECLWEASARGTHPAGAPESGKASSGKGSSTQKKGKIASDKGVGKVQGKGAAPQKQQEEKQQEKHQQSDRCGKWEKDASGAWRQIASSMGKGRMREDVWDARGAHGEVWDAKEPMEAHRQRWR